MFCYHLGSQLPELELQGRKTAPFLEPRAVCPWKFLPLNSLVKELTIETHSWWIGTTWSGCCMAHQTCHRKQQKRWTCLQWRALGRERVSTSRKDSGLHTWSYREHIIMKGEARNPQLAWQGTLDPLDGWVTLPAENGFASAENLHYGWDLPNGASVRKVHLRKC